MGESVGETLPTKSDKSPVRWADAPLSRIFGGRGVPRKAHGDDAMSKMRTGTVGSGRALAATPGGMNRGGWSGRAGPGLEKAEMKVGPEDPTVAPDSWGRRRPERLEGTSQEPGESELRDGPDEPTVAPGGWGQMKLRGAPKRDTGAHGGEGESCVGGTSAVRAAAQ